MHFNSYFEFRLCPNVQAKQGCLDKHLLKLLGGSPSKPQPRDLKTRFYPRFGSRIYEIKARLPAGEFREDSNFCELNFQTECDEYKF